MASREDALRAKIAELEAHQDGRREHIGVIEALIERRQIEIQNLRARLEAMQNQPPDSSQRAVLSAV